MGDLLSVGYGSAGVSTFPEQWSRLALTDSLDEPLSAQVSQGYDDVQAVRTGHIVGLSVRITDIINDGTVVVTVTINGVPGTLQATLTSADVAMTVTQATGIDTFGPDDVVGLHLETSIDLDLPNPVNLEAWIDTAQSASTGSGGGGGGTWLEVNPTVYTATFTAVPGFVHLLGAPGKGAQIQLPVSTNNTDVIALKTVDPSYGWSIQGIPTLDGYSAWQPSPQDGYMIFMSAGDGLNWWRVSDNRALRIYNSGGPSPIPDNLNHMGQIDFYYPIVVDPSIGAGRVQVFLDPAATAAPSGHVDLVWRPGSGLTGPVVFATLFGAGSLFAAIDALKAADRALTFTVIVDDSIVSPAYQFQGILNCTNVDFKGLNKFAGINPVGTYAKFEDTQFYDLALTPNVGQLRKISNHLHIEYLGTLTAANRWTNTFALNNPGLFCEVERHSSIRCTGTFAFYDLTTVAFNPAYVRLDGGAFINDGYEVVKMTGAIGLQVYIDGHPFDIANVANLLGDDTLRGNAAATASVISVTEQVTASEIQTNMVNPIEVYAQQTRRGIGTVQNVNAGSILATQSVNPVSCTGAANIQLPSAVNARGIVITIKSVSTSTAVLTVTTTGGQTIDGAANFPLTAANKHLTVISDGTNWLNIASN